MVGQPPRVPWIGHRFLRRICCATIPFPSFWLERLTCAILCPILDTHVGHKSSPLDQSRRVFAIGSLMAQA